MNSSLPYSRADIEKYINIARTKPRDLIPYIEAQIKLCKDNRTIRFPNGLNYSTNQGIKAWHQAVQFLKKQNPLSPMKRNAGLDAAAAAHVNDLAAHHIFGHNSSNGMGMSARLRQHVNWDNGQIAENVGQDFSASGRDHALQFILAFIIDDGVSNRGHRNSIFNPNLNYVGIGTTKADRYLVVLDFATYDLKPIGGGSSSFGSSLENIPNLGSQPQKKAGFDIPSQKLEGGGRKVVSSSSSTKTSTVNGVTTTVTVVTKQYSDGSKETETQTKTSSR